MTASFLIEGQEFVALNGGPQFTFSQAISFVVNCESQEEVDELWEKLSEGGEKQQCGWLKDKFGVSWQIVCSDIFNENHFYRFRYDPAFMFMLWSIWNKYTISFFIDYFSSGYSISISPSRMRS